MNTTLKTLCIALACLGLGGCASFYDLDELVRSGSEGGTDSGTNGDSETTGGTDSRTNTDLHETDTDTDTDTGSDTDTGTGTDTASASVSDSESVSVDTVTCDDDTVCEAFADGQCSPLCDTETVDCGCLDSLLPYCVENGCRQCDLGHDELCGGFYCDTEAFVCETECAEEDSNCKDVYHCEGQACVLDLESGESCDEASDCADGLQCGNGVCCDETKNTCCKTTGDCDDPAEPLCDAQTHTCVLCTALDECAAQIPPRPHCDADGQCVECANDDQCRLQDTDTSTPEKEWASPYGFCTPDRVCTCKVSEANPTGNCSAVSCPAGYACAQDLPGEIHYSCLRLCGDEDRDTDSDTNNDFSEGLGCTLRNKASGTAYVWAPPTTCHAFARIGSSCKDSTSICSVDGSDPIQDAYCIADYCTYACANSSYCQTDPNDTDSEGCGSAIPYNGACLP